MRSSRLAAIALLAAGISTLGVTADAQTNEEMKSAPLKVLITLTKMQGDKRISATPYTLNTSGEDRASLRMLVQVPIPTTTTTAGTDGKPATTVQGVQYKEIGTSIDCTVRHVDGNETARRGAFKLFITISDSVVYAPDGIANNSLIPPTIRMFSSSNTAVLKDGETTQFVVATDKATGETMRADVTLTVIK